MDENRSLGDVNSDVNQEENHTTENKNEVNTTQNNPQQTTANKENQEQKQVQKPIDTQTTPKVIVKKKRKFHLYHIKNIIKKAHPLNIKAKLEHYKFEYSRILHLARKPTKQEFKELSIMVIVGTFIIGIIGFIIQMIIQVI